MCGKFREKCIFLILRNDKRRWKLAFKDDDLLGGTLHAFSQSYGYDVDTGRWLVGFVALFTIFILGILCNFPNVIFHIENDNSRKWLLCDGRRYLIG